MHYPTWSRGFCRRCVSRPFELAGVEWARASPDEGNVRARCESCLGYSTIPATSRRCASGCLRRHRAEERRSHGRHELNQTAAPHFPSSLVSSINLSIGKWIQKIGIQRRTSRVTAVTATESSVELFQTRKKRNDEDTGSYLLSLMDIPVVAGRGAPRRLDFTSDSCLTSVAFLRAGDFCDTRTARPRVCRQRRVGRVGKQ